MRVITGVIVIVIVTVTYLLQRACVSKTKQTIAFIYKDLNKLSRLSTHINPLEGFSFVIFHKQQKEEAVMACAIVKISKTSGINRLRNITAIFKERNTPTLNQNSLVFCRFLSFKMSKETHFFDGYKPKINLVFLNHLSMSAAANYAFQANPISKNAGHMTNNAAEEDLRILAKEGKLKEAMEYFASMEEKGTFLDSYTYNCVLQCCVDRKALGEGKRVIEHLNRTSFRPDVSVNNRMLELYGKCGRIQDARQLFYKMSEQDSAY